MRVDLLTREYPPHVYGGAGVHVTELARALPGAAADLDVRVRCLDGPRTQDGVTGYTEPADLAGVPPLGTLAAGLGMARDVAGADLVHSHTWYANLAGHVAGLLHGIPHVVTAHSLEPLRPWKAEQLGGGYAVTSWAERTAVESADAVVAVSAGMRDDILRAYPRVDPARVHVVHNGVDVQAWRRPEGAEADEAWAVARRHGVDPERPSVLFVGRVTRQKGLPYLLRAARLLPPEVQLVLCAGAPDTPEIAAEVAALVAELRERRSGVVWLRDMLPQREVVALLAASTVFACPSIYEPLGIVNLEAMAVGVPVVATATGGIPEVVEDGRTGVLVPVDQGDGGEPRDPDAFVAGLAAALAGVLADRERAAAMGRQGRSRVEEHFTWAAVAARTVAVYRSVLG